VGTVFCDIRETQSKSIGAMKKAEVAKDLDPDDLKILDWKEGKERNIRYRSFLAEIIRTSRRKLKSFKLKYL
jgi:hypothetical protein